MVTGATGFIGRTFVKEIARYHQVVGVGRDATLPVDKTIEWINWDLSEITYKPLFPTNIDVVVALAQSREYRQFPEQAEKIFNVNVASTLNLLEYARKAGVRLFLLASTANVYRPSSEKISESWVVEPATFYARSKHMAELLVQSYSEYFMCVILRLFTVYGPGQQNMLLPSLIDRVRGNTPLQIQGKREFGLSPIYIDDVVQVAKTIIEDRNEGVGCETYNVGGDEATNIRELGNLIGDALNTLPKFEFGNEDNPGGWIANNSKLKSHLNLKPFTGLKDGIKKVILNEQD